MSDIELLLQLLKFIDNEENHIDIDNRRDVHPLVEAVVYLSTECLTIDNNYGNIQLLKDAGYSIYPGERDRFGWLTVWIKMKNRKVKQILFG